MQLHRPIFSMDILSPDDGRIVAIDHQSLPSLTFLESHSPPSMRRDVDDNNRHSAVQEMPDLSLVPFLFFQGFLSFVGGEIVELLGRW